MQLCECGCGEAAPLAARTDRASGRVKGEPQRFVKGHRITHGRYRDARRDGVTGAAAHRLIRYGLTPAQYDALVVEQDGKCAICRQGKRLVVDHDHETGEVRGLLCHFCNHNLEWTETFAEERGRYLSRG